MINHIYLEIVKNGIYEGIRGVILNKKNNKYNNKRFFRKNSKYEQFRYKGKNINKIYNIIKLFDEK